MKTHQPTCLSRCTCTLVLLTLVVGCAAPPTAHKEPVMAAGPALASPSARPTEAPSIVSDLPRPRAVTISEDVPRDIPEPTLTKTLPSGRISDLDLADATDVSTVLRAMAKAADVNILISPNVTGEISFAFHDVSWDEAFRSVIASAGLAYMWEGDVLRVMTVEDIRAELDIEAARKEREGIKAELRMIEPLMMQVFHIRYARARAIGDMLRVLLTGQPGDVRDALGPVRSFVAVDEDSNAIVVHAIREDLVKARALIEQLDRAKDMILIEARIVEATRDTARQLGVQWGGERTTLQGGRRVTLGGPGVTLGGYASDFPAQFALDQSASGFTLGFISDAMGATELLNMQLTALQRAGRIDIVSSPSITTLDNELAIIESGEERAYRVNTGMGGDSRDFSVEWKKAVLKLEVRPSIVGQQYLRLEISANKDSFDETRPTTNNEFPVNTKHARTTVLLQEGETVVIGGLSTESRSDAETGVPYLMNIPLLGRLFKSTGKTEKFDDTLIFITPHILRSER